MRRNLLVVALGISLLILGTWLGTLVTSIVPQRVTAQVQTAHVGPYQIMLRVNPNPPLITQPATLNVQVLMSNSQQPVTNAHVTLASNMETMDMGTDISDAHTQLGGNYSATVQFSMSGLWKVQVNVAAPGTPPASAVFEVAAQ